MQISRRFTREGQDPFAGIEFAPRASSIRNPNGSAAPEAIELARSTDAEKQSQLKRLQLFHERNAGQSAELLERLRRTVIENGNTFEVLMDAVRGCSLGELTHTLYDVGGRYRRNM